MPRPVKKRSKKAGLPPGTLVHIGERKSETTRITLFDYDEQQVEEKEITRAKECALFKDNSTVTWINVAGLHQVEVLEELNTMFRITSSGPGGYPEYRPAAEDGRLWQLPVYRFEDALYGRQSGETKSKANRSVSSWGQILSFLSRKRKAPFLSRFESAFATGKAASGKWDRIIWSMPFWIPLSINILSSWKIWGNRLNSWKKNWSPVRLRPP